MKRHYRNLISVFAVLFTAGVTLCAQEAQRTDSLVWLPYNVSKPSGQTTGMMFSISPQDLSRRVSGDLRSRLVGMVPGLEVTENGGAYFGSISSNLASYAIGGGGYNINMKGFGTVVAIIDDMLVPFNQLLLEPNQIESVTVFSDVLDKSKFGPMGSNGNLYIRTHRGEYDTPLKIKTSFDSGIRLTERIPEWLSGEEYAVYNNKARLAAGYTPLYSDEDIAAFQERDPYSQTTPNVDYQSLMLKRWLPTSNLNLSLSAGSHIVKYAFALNGFHSGDIQKGSADYFYDKINYSGSVSSRIGRYIEAGASFIGLFGAYKGDRTSWNSYRSVPGIAFPLTLSTTTDDNGDEVTIFGASKVYPNNPYAATMVGGYQTKKVRSGLFQAYVDADFSWILPGLKSKTSLMTNSFVYSNIGMNHDYLAYYWDKDEGVGEISTHTGQKSTSRSLGGTAVAENLSMYEKLYFDRTFGGHTINLGTVLYLNRAFNQSETDFERYLFLVGNADWSYGNRYAVQFNAQYSGSDRFAKGSRFGFFPSIGLSWTVSNEAFMEDVKGITYLKLHAQAGTYPDRDNATGSHYLYEMVYSRASGYQYGPTSIGAASHWFGTTNRASVNTTTTQYGNPNLTWNTMRQIDAGIDLTLFGCLDLSAEYFTWDYTGNIADISGALPSVFGFSDIVAYANHSRQGTSGLITALQYHKQIGDLKLRVGASASTHNRIYKKIVSDFYSPGNEHLKKTGTSPYAVWGLDCIGRYTSEQQIQENPAYVSKDLLRTGDLMYRDVNGDGTIDDNDRMVIGNTTPKLRYGVYLGLEYKGFDFEVVGTGRWGGEIELNSDYFFNGWGTGNYSAFVKDEMYPNLSYAKSSNNFVMSSYWLTKQNWFKIQAFDVGYTFRLDKSLKEVRLDIKGENLLTLTKVKYIDPEAPDAGVTARPLMRVFTAGVSLNF